MSPNRNRKTERELTTMNGSPALTLTWQLKELGLTPDDRVIAEPQDDCIVIRPADTAEHDLAPQHRDNIPPVPVDSGFVAHTIGNRLWEVADHYRQTGDEHVADETEHLARRFHAYADKLRGDADE